MNRRSLFRILAALPFIGIPAIAKPRKYVKPVGGHISMYDIGKDETKYKWIRSFDTEELAIEFVQSLIPELIDVRYRETIFGSDNMIRSGYRGAIRYAIPPKQEIVATTWGVRSKLTDEWVDIAPKDMWMYNCEFAWLCISQLRVNNKPVHLSNGKSGLPKLMIMPFQKGNPTMTKV